MTFGSDGGEASSSSGCIAPPRGGSGAALLERSGGAPGTAPGGRGALGLSDDVRLVVIVVRPARRRDSRRGGM